MAEAREKSVTNLIVARAESAVLSRKDLADLQSRLSMMGTSALQESGSN